jgi:hypothetical protein
LVSPYLWGSASRSLNLGGAACTTWLTSTRGSKNISAEGGPERSQVPYGP